MEKIPGRRSLYKKGNLIMPVFDFNHTPETEDTKGAECTYSIFYSDAPQAAPEQPILVLDTKGQHNPIARGTEPIAACTVAFGK